MGKPYRGYSVYILHRCFWHLFLGSINGRAVLRFLAEQSKKLLAAGTIIFFMFPVFSILSMAMMNQAEGESIEVVVVQPNSDSYQPFGGLPSLDDLIDKLLQLSDKERTGQTDLIIWPE